MLHVPVLLHETLNFFSQSKLFSFIDGTVGMGGHSKAFLEQHPEIENFYGLDQDEAALECAAITLKEYEKKVRLIHTNFDQMSSLFPKESIDGILLDVGVSSMQLDTAERGFSFNNDGPLDMRMDKSQHLDAKKIVNTYSERDLGNIFREVGEERKWRAAARLIVELRTKKRFETTRQLVEALQKILPFPKRGQIHPATRIFQALRITVNDELNALKRGIEAAFVLLRPSGRLAIITFHSLEDRIVKHTFLKLANKTILTKKPLIATPDEVRLNPRSRSAKLRVLEKIDE